MSVDVNRVRKEEGKVILEKHRCDPRKWKHLLTPDGEYDTSQMTEYDDLLIWDVWFYGQAIPGEIPFQVTAMCPACDDLVHRWFAWTSLRVAPRG